MTTSLILSEICLLQCPLPHVSVSFLLFTLKFLLSSAFICSSFFSVWGSVRFLNISKNLRNQAVPAPSYFPVANDLISDPIRSFWTTFWIALPKILCFFSESAEWHCKADRYHYKCTISSSKWASTRSAVILHFTGKCNPVCTHVDKPSVCVCIPTLTFSPVRNKMSLLLFKVTNLSIYALDQSILLSQNTSQIPSLVYLIARLIELFFHITKMLKPFPFTKRR